MRAYSCFLVNEAGDVQHAQIIEAETDEDALVKTVNFARRSSTSCTIKIWEGARKVFPQQRERIDIELIKRLFRKVGIVVFDDSPVSPLPGASDDQANSTQ